METPDEPCSQQPPMEPRWQQKKTNPVGGILVMVLGVLAVPFVLYMLWALVYAFSVWF